MSSEFRISGVVVERGTGRPLPGLVVRAYDKDRLYDDLLGEATTDEAGRFELRYGGEDFQELFEKQPDIYFRVLDAAGNELHSTESAVRWGAGAAEEFTIELPEGAAPSTVVKDVPAVPEGTRGGGGKDDEGDASRPYLRPTRSGGAQGIKRDAGEIKVERTAHPLPRATLGDLKGLAAEVTGPEEFPLTLLVQPFEPDALTGIDPTTVRVFRLDEKTGALKPVWNSGVNYTHGFTWAKITRPGTYVPVGLPRDRLLRELLRQTARERVYEDAERPERVLGFARQKMSLFGAERAEELEGVRQFLAAAELQTGAGAYTEADLRVGRGGHPLAFPLPGGASPEEFQRRLEQLELGASVWSSCAYDSASNTIYAGTGNITGDNGLPDDKYGSGAIALDADTGAFRGFLSPAQSTSYRPGDVDVDVPAAPTIFRRGGQNFVAIGSKNGSFFLLNPNTMAVLRDRQLLPKDAATGARIDTVDPHIGFPENKWGVMATAAVHEGLGIIYVGLGGYDGIDDYRVTPFMRALDWETLEDAWVTQVDTVGANQVSRYVAPRPPMYTNPKEAGLSSPAVVNDVVFVSTSTVAFPQKANLYALDAADGHCLWAAPTINITAEYPYCLGPAIYGNYVVIGAGNRVYIYKLSNGLDIWRFEEPLLVEPWWRRLKGWPDPPPDWGLIEVLRDLARGRKS